MADGCHREHRARAFAEKRTKTQVEIAGYAIRKRVYGLPADRKTYIKSRIVANTPRKKVPLCKQNIGLRN